MSSALPSRLEAFQRLLKAAPPNWVIGHCTSVERLAHAMARRAIIVGHDIDIERVSRAALLHDIGRSISQGVDHAYLGADMLRKRPRLPEALVRLVETHTGAGLDADEAKAAGLPERDFMPRTLEAKIVAHADNLFSGSDRLSLDDVMTKYERKGLPEAGKRIRALHEELRHELDADIEMMGPSDLPALVA